MKKSKTILAFAALVSLCPGILRGQMIDSGVGQNQFTYTAADPAVCTIYLVVQISPTNLVEQLARVTRFVVDDIGNSVKQWNAANPDGKPVVSNDCLIATVTFTGLPLHNGDFGNKMAKLMYHDQVLAQNPYQVFFPKYGTSHPHCETCPGCPNWFYYWREGGVCGIPADCVYDPELEFGGTNPLTGKIGLGPDAAEINKPFESKLLFTGIYTNITVGGNGTGIVCVAETIQHEDEHIAIFVMFQEDTDTDGDGIPDFAEFGYGDIMSDPINPNTYNHPRHPNNGDQEIRCHKAEKPLIIPVYPEKDWADPGCQHKNQCGPRPQPKNK